MTLALIAAHDEGLVIGNKGGLPWHIPADLQYFKAKTRGHTVVMGRKTWESIGCKPLKGRHNLVVSRSRAWEEVPTFRSLESALASVADRDLVYIVGGQSLYEEALPLADRLVLTHVKGTYEGDTFFPDYRSDIGTTWEEVFREEHDTHAFVTYERTGR